jgi:molecular chaperone HscB
VGRASSSSEGPGRPICWSCEKDAGDGATCAACGAIQPPDRTADRFAVLGAPRRFGVDLDAVERRYKELTRVLHPDRFARADPRARRASLARSVQLNEAWRTVKDPVRRAEYLLSLQGIEVGGEEGTVRRDGDRKERVPVPPALLMEVMELREGLAEARAAGDVARVSALSATVRQRREEALAVAAAALDASPARPDEASAALVSVRYYDRFLEEAVAPEAAEQPHAS